MWALWADPAWGVEVFYGVRVTKVTLYPCRRTIWSCRKWIASPSVVTGSHVLVKWVFIQLVKLFITPCPISQLTWSVALLVEWVHISQARAARCPHWGLRSIYCTPDCTAARSSLTSNVTPAPENTSTQHAGLTQYADILLVQHPWSKL